MNRILPLLLILAACGGASTEASTTTSTAAPSTTTTASPPVATTTTTMAPTTTTSTFVTYDYPYDFAVVDTVIEPGEWDQSWTAVPAVVIGDDGVWYMFYSGDGGRRVPSRLGLATLG